VEVQGVLLDYAAEGGGNDELLLKAWIALAKYGEAARILLAYGSEPEFKTVLKKYGEPIIPVIQYSASTRSRSDRHGCHGKALDAAQAATASAWNHMTREGQAGPACTGRTEARAGSRGTRLVCSRFHRGEGTTFSRSSPGSATGRRWNQTDRWQGRHVVLHQWHPETRDEIRSRQVAASDVGWPPDVALIAAPR
jgi:hypothetical protein